jgi:ketosteroid isomerase-like protein
MNSRIIYQFSLILLLLLFMACQPKVPGDITTWKQEITDTELAFSALAQKEGIPQAFLAFAADDAVLMRNNTIIKGKKAIDDRMKANPLPGQLLWAPDFVDVAASGDLGYTYGKFTFTMKDSTGQESVSEGIFHTVWKRQEDGSWKFVWD